MPLGRLDAGSVILWSGATFVATILAVVLVRRPARRRDGRPTRLGLLPLVLLVMPWLALLHSYGSFAGGMHPTVQANGGLRGAVGHWGGWAGAWPVLLLGSLGTVVAGVVTTIVLVVATASRRALAASALALLAGILTVSGVLRNFPST